MTKIAIVVSALALLTVGTAARGDSDFERRTLAGLPGVYVLVHQPDADAARAGLSADNLRADVEDVLRAAGIPLLTEEESRRTPGVPWLQLIVSTLPVEKKNIYVWWMQLALLQRACMERDAKICESTRTWETNRFGTVGSYKQKSIREDLRVMAGEFGNAFRIANSVR